MSKWSAVRKVRFFSAVLLLFTIAMPYVIATDIDVSFSPSKVLSMGEGDDMDESVHNLGMLMSVPALAGLIGLFTSKKRVGGIILSIIAILVTLLLMFAFSEVESTKLGFGLYLLLIGEIALLGSSIKKEPKVVLFTQSNAL